MVELPEWYDMVYDEDELNRIIAAIEAKQLGESEER